MPEDFPNFEAASSTQVQLLNICNTAGKNTIIEVIAYSIKDKYLF